MSDLLKETNLPEDCKNRYRDALCYSFYRSACTVVGELQKYDYPPKERRKRVKEILEAYSQENMGQPTGF